MQVVPPPQHKQRLGLRNGIRPLPVDEKASYVVSDQTKAKVATLTGSNGEIEHLVAMPELAREHRLHVKKLSHYWRDAKWSSYITTPAIVMCIIPVALMDFWASVYQFICFPAYGIPKVQRRDYIILDRSQLRYLNSIEQLNCAYCGYVNGAIAYVQEIAARTEQHWCPIKHAFRLKTMHSRYQHFFEYGDAKQYRNWVEEVRRDFDDLKK
jgi:hypothetical protein